MLTDDEREVWRGFLAAEPEFAGDTIGTAVDGPDPPDVLCVTTAGKKIGVELTRFVEHDHVTSRKERESFEDSYLRIIESANHGRPGRIGWVWLHPKQREVKPENVPQFQEELYEFLARENGLSEPEWDRPQGAAVQDFIGFPVLAAYLDSLWIFPRRRLEHLEAGRNWIMFESAGKAFSGWWMVRAAVDRILAKIADYESRNLHVRDVLDELHLVCHCSDEALLQSTPMEVPGIDFGALAARAARALANERGVFDRIFLFNPHQARKVIQVYAARTAKRT